MRENIKLQVIDAMRDKFDCQREHLSRKLAEPIKALSQGLIGRHATASIELLARM
jgi:hypothetical protein